jgi:CHAD domain-containing protein
LPRPKPFAVSEIVRYMEREAANLRSCAAQVRGQDVDALHDMRVASRRLRVALREAAALLPAEVGATLHETVSGITRALGHAREVDVMILMLEEYLQDAYGPWKRAVEHATSELRAVRGEAQAECLLALERISPEHFDGPLEQVLRTLRAMPDTPVPGLEAGLLRRLARVRKTYRDWCERGEENDLHRTRVAVKKLRYAAEFYAPAYGAEMGEFIADVKHAQELLGDWRDAVVLADALRRIEKHAPYREVQGFPLVREAFILFAEHKAEDFQDWARAFFAPEQRAAHQRMLEAA